jgi:hypothetical protein
MWFRGNFIEKKVNKNNICRKNLQKIQIKLPIFFFIKLFVKKFAQQKNLQKTFYPEKNQNPLKLLERI